MRHTQGWLASLGCLLLAATGIQAAPVTPTSPSPPALPSAGALASSLRGLMLQFIPAPLYEDHSHWDQKKEVEEIKFRGKGLKVKAEKVKVMKNHGVWHKVLVTAPLIDRTLVCDVRNLQPIDPERIRFTVFLALNAQVEYDRQRWDKGNRLWSGSVRARMRVLLTLNCEVQTRMETGNHVLPDMVCRMRVLSSDLKYDNLVVTHVPGVGGDLAKALGDGIHSAIKQLHPSLERKMLERANAAIVKAADTKEVRVSLSKLLGGS